MKKGSKFRHCEHNGLKREKNPENFVTLIFIYFCGKGFRHFLFIKFL